MLKQYYDKKTGKYGFKDEKGKLVIECKYDNVFSPKDGFIPVALNGEKSYINEKGERVVEHKYNWGDISDKGEQKVEFKYDKPISFVFDFGEALLDGKYGYVDRTGKEVVPCKFSNIDAVKELKKLEKYKVLEKGLDMKAEFTKKICNAFDKNANYEEIDGILEEYRGKLSDLVNSTKQENRSIVFDMLAELIDYYSKANEKSVDMHV